MFGLTKKPIQKQEENKSNIPGQVQPKNFVLEDAIIHTMQDDLEKLKNPNAFQDTEIKKANLIQADLKQKQQNNPFMINDEASWHKRTLSEEKEIEIKKPEVQKPPSNLIIDRSPQKEKVDLVFTNTETKVAEKIEKEVPVAIPTRNIIQPLLKNVNQPLPKDNEQQKSSRKFILFSSLSFVSLLAISAVGFYFIKIKTTAQKPSTIAEPILPIETPAVIEPAPKPILTYSETAPNYLRIEDGSLIATDIKAIMDKVAKEGYAQPVEFIVTDIQNKPLAFKDFSGLFKLKFSAGVMSSLGDNFSLYVYNDSTGPRTGLAIELKNNLTINKALLQEEKTFANEINSLFFTTEYKTDKLFANSEHGDAKIRFQNIISPDMLSVDYSIYQKKLLIGTTKLTLRAIIDKFNGIVKNIPAEIIPTIQTDTVNNTSE
jgi:hypothetical protein